MALPLRTLRPIQIRFHHDEKYCFTGYSVNSHVYLLDTVVSVAYLRTSVGAPASGGVARGERAAERKGGLGEYCAISDRSIASNSSNYLCNEFNYSRPGQARHGAQLLHGFSHAN